MNQKPAIAIAARSILNLNSRCAFPAVGWALAALVLGLAGSWAPVAVAQINALTARVTADALNNTNTFQDVPGLSWYVAANAQYAFVCEISYTTVDSNTALQLSVNGPAFVASGLRYSVTTTTAAQARHSASQTAYDTVTNPGTSGGGAVLPATIAGVVETSAAGTFAVRFRSEGTLGVVVQRGSACMVYR